MITPGDVASRISSRQRPGVKVRELLGQRPTPRYAEHIDGAGVAEPCQELVGQDGKRRKPVRDQRGGRAAYAGDVEDDDGHVIQC